MIIKEIYEFNFYPASQLEKGKTMAVRQKVDIEINDDEISRQPKRRKTIVKSATGPEAGQELVDMIEVTPRQRMAHISEVADWPTGLDAEKAMSLSARVDKVLGLKPLPPKTFFSPREYKMPPNTCPIIDDAQSQLREVFNEKLEKIRDANEELRHAANNYKNDNASLCHKMNELQEVNAQLHEQNKGLFTIFQETIEGTDREASRLAELSLENIKLKEMEPLLHEALKVGTQFVAFKSRCSLALRQYIDVTRKERLEKERLVRAQAISKLSAEEKRALGLTEEEKEDEDDDE